MGRRQTPDCSWQDVPDLVRDESVSSTLLGWKAYLFAAGIDQLNASLPRRCPSCQPGELFAWQTDFRLKAAAWKILDVVGHTATP